MAVLIIVFSNNQTHPKMVAWPELCQPSATPENTVSLPHKPQSSCSQTPANIQASLDLSYPLQPPCCAPYSSPHLRPPQNQHVRLCSQLCPRLWDILHQWMQSPSRPLDPPLPPHTRINSHLLTCDRTLHARSNLIANRCHFRLDICCFVDRWWVSALISAILLLRPQRPL